jgi:tetratricopeptide (TPR) repeat protein
LAIPYSGKGGGLEEWTAECKEMYQTQRPQQAAGCFEALLDRYPEETQLRRYLAGAYAKLGRLDDSYIQYQRFIEENPDDPAVELVLELLSAWDDSASEEGDRAHPSPRAPLFRRLYGQALLMVREKRGTPAEAVLILKRALDVCPREEQDDFCVNIQMLRESIKPGDW